MTGAPPGRSAPQLVADSVAGDATARDELYRRFLDPVRQTVRLSLVDGYRRSDLVDDIVQEVFTRALERLDSLRDPEAVLPWLRAIARHVTADYCRGLAAHPESELEDAADHDDPEPGPAEIMELTELAQLVRGTVRGLSDRDATAVWLVALYGATSAEVAAALGVSDGAARVILHRARRRLRGALALQLLAWQESGPSCPTFTALHANGELVEAARHVDGCDVCLSVAAAEAGVRGSSISAETRPASP